MIENEIYVDPFLSKMERYNFVCNYKLIQKSRTRNLIKKSQKVYRPSSSNNLNELVFNSFKNNKFVIILQSFSNNLSKNEILNLFESKKF